jgi:hypothetical protein
MKARMQATPFTEPYPDLLARLSARSVTKHFDAYADIDWEDRDHLIDARDPRFALESDEPLGATSWYRALPKDERATIGLHLAASRMRIGIDFENVLSRGLLEFASTCANGSPEMRYAYHEIIEESQHSLMFHEFVSRAGFDARGMRAIDARLARRVPPLGRIFPELFFLHVLAGEEPVDDLQRRVLSRGRDAHPLLRRIMQIHVTEEARHVCFATRFLEERVPRLGFYDRARLRLFAPFVLAGTTAAMLRVPGDVVRVHGIPRSALREAHASAARKEQIARGLRPIRALCTRLGLITPRTAMLWRWLDVEVA